MRYGLAALLTLALSTAASAGELGSLRLGVLAFGTVSWELDVIRHHRLDAEQGFTLEVQEFGSGDATNVALLGGAVDAIVDDWLWVSRQRAEGLPLTFIPYSSSVGALMVAADGGITTLADLAGRKIGVAGGPLDKSWLLIQAVAAERHGIDLAAAVEPVYGAPPLLTEKFRTGELAAVLNYWHYAARLEAAGFRQLIEVGEAQEALGVPADIPQLGYVFRADWAEDHVDLIGAFVRASQAAKTLLAKSDAEWERLRPLTKAEDDATLEALKMRFRAGIVRRWGDAERRAAAELYTILARLGGEELVGASPTLVEGTFFGGVTY